ncbi:hypothetical protein RRG08_049696 [Elysia crispata]|uniref:Uncharacterized protein n=1 Tax=Elysia crispata TaxID=231223 RepID=A0AAE0ZWM8_9GAST|nr:hypothetical protein RRG08_049696 [Elysia crispata]
MARSEKLVVHQLRKVRDGGINLPIDQSELMFNHPVLYVVTLFVYGLIPPTVAVSVKILHLCQMRVGKGLTSSCSTSRPFAGFTGVPVALSGTLRGWGRRHFRLAINVRNTKKVEESSSTVLADWKELDMEGV